uniref:Uncharacterized protein n=1 Tax=viral metagenome TaxID=1070528 RepID=A0A6M3JAH3_9ZZZZ
MIEIIYGHKLIDEILHVDKLTIGYGLPGYSQIDFISVIHEEIDRRTGMCEWVSIKWSFDFWIFGRIFRDLQERIWGR